jgi:hypothetical protein
VLVLIFVLYTEVTSAHVGFFMHIMLSTFHHLKILLSQVILLRYTCMIVAFWLDDFALEVNLMLVFPS